MQENQPEITRDTTAYLGRLTRERVMEILENGKNISSTNTIRTDP